VVLYDKNPNTLADAPQLHLMLLLKSVLAVISDGARKSNGARIVSAERPPASEWYPHLPTFHNKEGMKQPQIVEYGDALRS
jgi:hypothetical protein